MSAYERIAKLASDRAPVRKLANVHQQVIRFALYCGVVALLFFFGTGLRPRVVNAPEQAMFLIGLVLLVTMTFSAAVSAVSLARPGRNNLLAQTLSIATLIVWPVSTCMYAPDVGTDYLEGSACGVFATFVGAVMSIGLCMIVRSGYVTRPLATSFFTVVASAAAGAIVLHLECPSLLYSHVMYAHILPLYGVIGAVQLLFCVRVLTVSSNGV